MKKLSTLMMLVIITALYFTSCDNPPPQENTDLPKGLITQKQSEDMQALYVENQYKAITEINARMGDQMPDSREIWFSLDEMKKYIAYVEHGSDSLKLKNLGIRVYLAGKKEDNGKVYTTVFFAPTHRDDPKTGSIGSMFFPSANAQTGAVNQNTTALLNLDFGQYGRPPFSYTATTP